METNIENVIIVGIETFVRVVITLVLLVILNRAGFFSEEILLSKYVEGLILFIFICWIFIPYIKLEDSN